ncbi:MAG: hypothetical protein RL215_1199 [Planctomycetota bacterium]
MATTKSAKAADTAQICRELLAALDKFYGKSHSELPAAVLDGMLLSVCLEDSSWEAARAAYDHLLASYFDLNEIRVSSTAELSRTLRSLPEADWKGLRIRAILRHVFESSYSFDFEKLRRQTPELTLKTLRKITELSPFVREFALQEILGSHTVALDGTMLRAAQSLGLVPVSMQLPEAMEFLKGVVRKSDASSFSRQLRRFATDSRFTAAFSVASGDGGAAGVMLRFEEITTGKVRKPAKKADSSPVPAPAPAPAPAKAQKHSTSAPAAAQGKSNPKPAVPAKVEASKKPAAPAKAPAKAVAKVAAKAAAKPASKTAAPAKSPSPKTAASRGKPAAAASGKSSAGAAKSSGVTAKSSSKAPPAAKKGRK